MKIKIIFSFYILFMSFPGVISTCPGNNYILFQSEQNAKERKNIYSQDTTKYFGWRADISTVRCVAYNNDGTLLLSCGNDKDLKVWNPKTGALLKTMSGHTDIVNSISFSPDGSKLVSASNDHSVKLWDVITGKEITTFTGHIREVYAAVFSPDGKYIASGSGGPYNIRIWDVEKKIMVKSFTGTQNNGIRALVFSPDGQYVASGTSSNGIVVWDIKGDTTIFEKTVISYGEVSCLCYTADGKKIISGGDSLILWDLFSHSKIKSYGMGVSSIIYSKDKNMYFMSQFQNNNIIAFITDGLILKKEITINSFWPYTISICPNGTNIACGGWIDKSLPNLRIYDISSLLSVDKLSITSEYQLFQNYPNPFNPSTVISFQLSGNNNITLKIYDILGREVQTLIKEQKSAGKHSIIFDAKNLPGGVYYYNLVGRGFSTTKSMLLLK